MEMKMYLFKECCSYPILERRTISFSMPEFLAVQPLISGSTT